ncbi:hypothetical protein BEP19_05610 [Ammoniphilus oxalaticus]|uniref:Ribonuclease G n=1 Tax=Ammoniphilus oxalaticus TaxID=66863 RepID=A0A419SIS0_9BACL|nr:Rne/Rng family ribonuclease [Ammoniphilus oxalaticus]RKD23903.1 hypothetical protein BEP19_05610 [Ammoniphilus oxalaticus]
MKRIIANCAYIETRVAVMENNHLVDLFIERSARQGSAGKIYKARVIDVLPGMQAAFVDIGQEKNGYLHVNDCLAAEQKKDGKAPSIREVVRQGQELLVQVTKEALGSKGAKMTAQLSFPGRFLVYMPTDPYIGVSAKIKNEHARDGLRELLSALCEGTEGVIARTVAEEASEEEIRADFIFLKKLWERTQVKAKAVKSPEIVHRDVELVTRIARDILTDEIEEFWIDDARQYRNLLEQLGDVIPTINQKLKLYQGATAIFDHFEVENELEKVLLKKVWLKSGGYLVIDQTEAFTAIDINTGKFVGRVNLAETVFQTNREAIDEIFRQLRVRDIGGIILVDFIDMRNEQHRSRILQEMKERAKQERTRIHVYGFTQLGLLEMTRKKVRQTVDEIVMKTCSACEGTGKTRSEMTIAAKLEREIKEYVSGMGVEALLIEVNPSLIAFFEDRNFKVKEMEQRTGAKLILKTNLQQSEQDYRILFTGSFSDAQKRAASIQAE